MLKKLIQTQIIFFCKGQMTHVLEIHYCIDGIHGSALAFGPLDKDGNLLHSPAPSPLLSAVRVSVSVLSSCLLKCCLKRDFQSSRTNPSVELGLKSQVLSHGTITNLHLLQSYHGFTMHLIIFRHFSRSCSLMVVSSEG